MLLLFSRSVASNSSLLHGLHHARLPYHSLSPEVCSNSCPLIHKLELEKAEEPEIKLPTFVGSQRNQGNSRRSSTSASLTMWMPLTVWITTNCRKFLKRWKFQTTLPASWEICMQVKKQLLELDTEQWTGSKLGKEYIKAIYCHPAFLPYMHNTLWEILGWMNHKLGSRLLGEI